MIHFVQYIPSFCEGFTPVVIDCETVDELLSQSPFSGYSARPDFDHFALDDNAVIAVFAEGFHWWVVGFLNPAEGLPLWEGWKFRDVDGNTYKGNAVRSSCGDEITLVDGRQIRVLRGRATA